jgi:hypothetical protein
MIRKSVTPATERIAPSHRMRIDSGYGFPPLSHAMGSGLPLHPRKVTISSGCPHATDPSLSSSCSEVVLTA